LKNIFYKTRDLSSGAEIIGDVDAEHAQIRFHSYMIFAGRPDKARGAERQLLVVS